MDESKIVSGDDMMICSKCGNGTKFASTNVVNKLYPKMWKCMVCGNLTTGEDNEDSLQT